MASRKILPHLDRKPVRARDEVEAPPPERARRRLRTSLTVAALFFALLISYPMLERTFSRSGDNDAMVTNCDRLAAHPADGLKLAPGIPMQQMNVPAARTECLRALSRAPHSARLQYQLSRAYLIANDYAPGLTYLRTAAAAGYPQAQFALAQMLLRGDGVPADACAGGRTMLAAARQRHLYARLYFGTYWLKNDFATCALDTSDAEVLHLIEDADALAATPAEHAEVATVQQAWHRQRG